MRGRDMKLDTANVSGGRYTEISGAAVTLSGTGYCPGCPESIGRVVDELVVGIGACVGVHIDAGSREGHDVERRRFTRLMSVGVPVELISFPYKVQARLIT